MPIPRPFAADFAVTPFRRIWLISSYSPVPACAILLDSDCCVQTPELRNR